MTSNPSLFDKRQSSVIEWLRFAMACMVVLLHAAGKGELGHDTFSYIRILLAHGICRVAVPVFFIISGYLFFTKLSEWNASVWRNKVKKRIHSLLIPYIAWNTLALFIFYAYAVIRAHRGGEVPVSFPAFFQQQKGFMYLWNTSNGSPIDYPLWFVRDLFLLSLGAPIIHVFLKKLKIPGLLLLVLGLFSIKSFPQGVLFYAIGAYLQMNRKNLLAVFSKFHVPCSIAALVCLVLLCVSFFEQGWWFQISQKGFILFGTLSTFHWAGILVGNKEIERNAFLSRSSFFIFAAHGILILDDFAFYICLHLFNGSSLTVQMADLVCRTGLTILICLLLYYLTERFLPKTTRFLTGNRSSRLSHA